MMMDVTLCTINKVYSVECERTSVSWVVSVGLNVHLNVFSLKSRAQSAKCKSKHGCQHTSFEQFNSVCIVCLPIYHWFEQCTSFRGFDQSFYTTKH